MRNQCGLGLHFVFVTMYFVATTYTCLAAQNTTVACFEHERLALLKFKGSVVKASSMLSSWVGSDCCQWHGVQCDNVTGNVERLQLRRAPRSDEEDYLFDHLLGYYYWGVACFGKDDYLVSNELSTSLAELSHLKYLDLSGNDFQGSRIPKFIGSFKELTYLNLSDANFGGIIPHHIVNLSNLKMLNIGSNNQHAPLTVSDIAWISGLPSLEYLDLSHVRLSGAKNLDMMLYMLPSLKELHLSSCDLTKADLGVIHNLSNIVSNIRHLDLSDNHYQGQIPHFFQNMTSLRFLDISFFDLSQTWNLIDFLSMIPSLSEFHLTSCNLDEIHLSHTHFNSSTITNIQRLDLSWNRFYSGRFPSILTNMTSLRVLDLSNSLLNSSVPIIPNLLELYLSGNYFQHWPEDVGIWRQCYLKQLRVSDNLFPMEMTHSPMNISECSQYALELLDLTSSLKGTIPKSLGRMVNLRSLHLSSVHVEPEGVFEFSDNYLNGSIPESLGKLRSLQVLDLSGNRLTGTIPTFHANLVELDLSRNELMGPIPNLLGKLKKLDLSSNHLNGSVPKCFGELADLRYMFLQNNQLMGPIPTSLGQLTHLRYLDVSNNSLEGLVYEAHFAKLSNLKYLNAASNSELTFIVSREWLPPFQLINIDLSSCKIADGFPQWLRNQINLCVISLSNTTISGPLPTWLQKMPIIPSIDFSHNNLSGPLINLPSRENYNSNFNEFPFSILFLQGNLFNESIPRSLCKMKKLGTLDLSKNKLTGKIPKCLKNLQSLQFMILSSNDLSGVIPCSIADMFSLNVLSLNGNNLSGELPREIWNLRELEILDLGDNAFFGKLPKSIGEGILRLAILRLHRNNFTGGIPRSFCNISFLQILDLANNKLTGTLPHCLGDFYAMKVNDMLPSISAYNDRTTGVSQVMKGVVMEYTKTRRFVINMDLSSNKLTGEIPVELTRLDALVGLNLSNNHLSGGIPQSIGNMTSINSLDFSGNELSGLIPPSIAALHFLSYLNLSNNNFSGRIPTGSQLQTLLDPSIYAGNSNLCGAPLPKNCSNSEAPTVTPVNNDDATNEPNMVWFYLDITCGFATGFWGFVMVSYTLRSW